MAMAMAMALAMAMAECTLARAVRDAVREIEETLAAGKPGD